MSSPGTLGKTILRIKERAPQCTEFIDLYLKDYLPGQCGEIGAPEPREFLDLVSIVWIEDQVMDARRQLFVAGILAVCTDSDRNNRVFEESKLLFDRTVKE
jgi:hypothetical protein